MELTSVFPSDVKDGSCPVRLMSSEPILPCPTPWQGTSWHPLQSCAGFKPRGVTSAWPCRHLSFSFFPRSIPRDNGPNLQLVPQRGTNGTKLICTVKCTVMKKAWSVWSGPFAALSGQNHKYLKDRVSSLALSHLDLSKLYATLINYFSLLIPVCLHEADNKIWAEGAARWDKIEAWTFFRLTQLLFVIWGDNMLSFMANQTKASEIPRMGGCARPQSCSICNCLGQAEHPKQNHLRLSVGSRYTRFHCPATA